MVNPLIALSADAGPAANVAINAPNALARTLLSVEQIKDARSRNALLDVRAESLGLANQKQRDLSGVLGRASTGDRGAVQDALAIDPQAARQLQAFFATADKQQIDNLERINRNAASLIFKVKAARPEDKPRVYQEALGAARELGLDISTLPPQYSPELETQFDVMLNQLQGIDDLVKQARGSFGTPQRGLDAQGRPAFFQTDDQGGTRRVSGFTPERQRTGQLTQAQIANNREVDDARAEIGRLPVPEGSTLLQEIRRRTKKATDTGRNNPDFDPLLTSAFSKARQRKVGGDAEFADFVAALRREGPAHPLELPGLEPSAQQGAQQGTPQTFSPGEKITIGGQEFIVEQDNGDGTFTVRNPQTGERFIAGQ